MKTSIEQAHPPNNRKRPVFVYCYATLDAPPTIVHQLPKRLLAQLAVAYLYYSLEKWRPLASANARR